LWWGWGVLGVVVGGGGVGGGGGGGGVGGGAVSPNKTALHGVA